MTLYHLHYNNGLDYEDNDDIPLGIYSTKELRTLSLERHKLIASEEKWPFSKDHYAGHFVEFESELDQDTFNWGN